jgi:hypothetical protein
VPRKPIAESPEEPVCQYKGEAEALRRDVEIEARIAARFREECQQGIEGVVRLKDEHRESMDNCLAQARQEVGAARHAADAAVVFAQGAQQTEFRALQALVAEHAEHQQFVAESNYQCEAAAEFKKAASVAFEQHEAASEEHEVNIDTFASMTAKALADRDIQWADVVNQQFARLEMSAVACKKVHEDELTKIQDGLTQVVDELRSQNQKKCRRGACGSRKRGTL